MKPTNMECYTDLLDAQVALVQLQHLQLFNTSSQSLLYQAQVVLPNKPNETKTEAYLQIDT